MRIHSILPFLFLYAGCALYAQTENPQLTINPSSARLSTNPTTAVFTADIVSPQNPLAVTLYLVDDSGAVLSSQGELRDDGISPDQVAGDKKFTSELQIPVDKRGLFRFMARAEFPSPIGVRQSMTEAFAVKMETPRNAEGDLWAQSFDDETYIHYSTEQSGIKTVKLLRAASSSGPWMLIDQLSYPGTTGGDVITGEILDSDPGVASHDYYYKIELYDANSALKCSYSPLVVPAFGRPDRVLTLSGSPPQSAVPLAQHGAAKKKPMSGRKSQR